VSHDSSTSRNSNRSGNGGGIALHCQIEVYMGLVPKQVAYGAAHQIQRDVLRFGRADAGFECGTRFRRQLGQESFNQVRARSHSATNVQRFGKTFD
jgi:hypothetical protein